jgi:hypothetical protein
MTLVQVLSNLQILVPKVKYYRIKVGGTHRNLSSQFLSALAVDAGGSGGGGGGREEGLCMAVGGLAVEAQAKDKKVYYISIYIRYISCIYISHISRAICMLGIFHVYYISY